MAQTVTPANPQPLHGRASLALKSLRFCGLLLIAIVLMPTVPLLGDRARQLVRWWHGRALRIFNIRLAIEGALPTQPVLIAANHCSWLDIVVLGHALDAAFVSKAEIGNWPLIGRFAHAAGTLFLARGANQTEQTTDKILSVLDSGRSVLLFPEGTTSRDPQPQRFHARLFAAAIKGGYPVLPLALRYADDTTPEDMHHALAPWVNEPNLWAHFRDLFRLRGLHAEIRLCEVLDPQGYDRRGLAQAARCAISHGQARAQAYADGAAYRRPAD